MRQLWRQAAWQRSFGESAPQQPPILPPFPRVGQACASEGPGEEAARDLAGRADAVGAGIEGGLVKGHAAPALAHATRQDARPLAVCSGQPRLLLVAHAVPRQPVVLLSLALAAAGRRRGG